MTRSNTRRIRSECSQHRSNTRPSAPTHEGHKEAPPNTKSTDSRISRCAILLSFCTNWSAHQAVFFSSISCFSSQPDFVFLSNHRDFFPWDWGVAFGKILQRIKLACEGSANANLKELIQLVLSFL